MKDQKGTSLVSVIVSFAVMMIVLLLLQISITASGRYATRADEIWKQTASADNKFVNGEGTKRGDVELIMKSETGGEEVWGKAEKWCGEDDPVKIYYIKPDP